MGWGVVGGEQGMFKCTKIHRLVLLSQCLKGCPSPVLNGLSEAFATQQPRNPWGATVHRKLRSYATRSASLQERQIWATFKVWPSKSKIWARVIMSDFPSKMAEINSWKFGMSKFQVNKLKCQNYQPKSRKQIISRFKNVKILSYKKVNIQMKKKSLKFLKISGPNLIKRNGSESQKCLHFLAKMWKLRVKKSKLKNKFEFDSS